MQPVSLDVNAQFVSFLTCPQTKQLQLASLSRARSHQKCGWKICHVRLLNSEKVHTRHPTVYQPATCKVISPPVMALSQCSQAVATYILPYANSCMLPLMRVSVTCRFCCRTLARTMALPRSSKWTGTGNVQSLSTSACHPLEAMARVSCCMPVRLQHAA